MHQISERVVATMSQAGRPLYLREILRLGRIDPGEKARVREVLAELVHEGRLVLLKGDRYGLLDLMHLVTGRLLVHPDGFGFVKPEAQDEPDLFVPARGLKGAVHGDRVVARVERHRGKRSEGSVLRILSREIRRVIGTFHRGRGVSTVIPEDERLLFEVLIPRRATARAGTGQVVVAEIESFPAQGRNPEGRVVEVLGDPDDFTVQTRIVIEKHDLAHVFPAEALAQAEALPQTVERDMEADRKDLRDLPLVTIDGAQARDFDDAVCVQKTRTGYTLTVAIADVSHYVPEGSPLDEAALARGTSVYFPNTVVPMLPEALSNHLCSLLPGEDRLALAVRISFDRKGQVLNARFSKAVIRSKRRFTYNEVRRILVDQEPDLLEKNRAHIEHLQHMAELAAPLHDQRSQRGGIDFDLPEPHIVLGMTGVLEDIVRRERNLAHMIIEEFMIAANEAVARLLSERKIPSLYRIHEEPDRLKVREFAGFAKTLGLSIEVPEEIRPQWCQEVLRQVSGQPTEYVINTVLLRTMKQAVYTPKDVGHFGLASPTYLHFTSPIRRYPDLVVHRILKANLRRVRKRPIYTVKRLEALGGHCSAQERVAVEAEREMLERLKVRFMADRVGETFEGVISGVASFGFFVELREVFVEGAVRLVDLADDYYLFDQTRHRLVGERTRRVFQIGQMVRVRVKGVNVARRHVNFEVVSDRAEK